MLGAGCLLASCGPPRVRGAGELWSSQRAAALRPFDPLTMLLERLVAVLDVHHVGQAVALFDELLRVRVRLHLGVVQVGQAPAR